MTYWRLLDGKDRVVGFMAESEHGRAYLRPHDRAWTGEPIKYADRVELACGLEVFSYLGTHALSGV